MNRYPAMKGATMSVITAANMNLPRSFWLNCPRRSTLRNSWLTWPRSSKTKSMILKFKVHSSRRERNWRFLRKGKGIERSRTSLLTSAIRKFSLRIKRLAISCASSLSFDWLPSILWRCSAVFGLMSLRSMMRATVSCQETVCMSVSGIPRRCTKKSRMLNRRRRSKGTCMAFQIQ